jgi:hypothetical protein
MFANTLITLAVNGLVPDMVQVTSVDAPRSTSSNQLQMDMRDV